ncbi:coniferyl aldehyde dehydrogenase [Paracoccus sp. SCSIO 75233]|uniref:coniferyl aldehyde dehydrogenase n=1 Tax=Paracoccus sp. SCSIO 75233 TaxID=3017782 RepID=UPI0022F092F7|nr:coniferyl aldehyde dehydrogenase [Paracoccus sp. SCSIO 75233]WBU53345.1 coniferyl aldehyde dehydrogenase [Paracoccus sp. SCSIO 75233]
MQNTAVTPFPQPAEEIQRLFDLQYRASRDEPAPDYELRRDRLDRLRKMLTENDKAFVEAINDDFGNRSNHETELFEIVTVLNALRHTRKHLKRWMRDERRPVDMAFKPASARIRHEPLGVIGIIAPWNFPMQTALTPLVDALAAGNRAMIKPSEFTPRFSELLRSLVAKYFDDAELTVVTGGVEVAQRFGALPFDHLVFTGSTIVGRKVMEAAAKNLTPVTLELGGKSPVVVAEDYPLEKAAQSVAFGKYSNSGQICVAPDYALVPRERVRDFAEAVIARAKKSFPTVAQNPDYTSMISERHRQRLVDAIEEARAAGATVLTHEDDGMGQARKIGPTVIIDAPKDGVLMNEEIFGPVLLVKPYDTLDDALAYIRDRDRPLALYVFTNDKATERKVLDGAISGGVTVNGTILHVGQDTLPFGGVGPSGMGAYHGIDGFRRLSHARSVHKVGFINGFEKMGPPWGGLANSAAKFLKRR